MAYLISLEPLLLALCPNLCPDIHNFAASPRYFRLLSRMKTPHWHVVSVRPIAGHRLALEFADGTRGVITYDKSEFTNALAPLANDAFFARVTIEHGAPTWPGGLDLAPDAMYECVKHGRPLPL
jgi:hypothetical protein